MSTEYSNPYLCPGDNTEARPRRLPGPGLGAADITNAEVVVRVHPPSPSPPPEPPRIGRDPVEDRDATAKRLVTGSSMNFALRENYGYVFYADTWELMPDMIELRGAWARLGDVVGVELAQVTLKQKDRRLRSYFEEH